MIKAIEYDIKNLTNIITNLHDDTNPKKWELICCLYKLKIEYKEYIKLLNNKRI